MKILVVRHGETDWNTVNRVQGATDNPLNKKGLEQARQTGENLKGTRIDRIYTSDMLRARQTTDGILKVLDQNIPVIVEPAFREQNFGIYEGWPRDNEEYQAEKKKAFKRFKDGESFLDVAARVYPKLNEIIETSADDETVLISCHGGICRMIASCFTDLDNEEFLHFFAENCQAYAYEIDREKWLTPEMRSLCAADHSSRSEENRKNSSES